MVFLKQGWYRLIASTGSSFCWTPTPLERQSRHFLMFYFIYIILLTIKNGKELTFTLIPQAISKLFLDRDIQSDSCWKFYSVFIIAFLFNSDLVRYF